MVGIRQRTVEE